jgi:hypothetical protein
MMCQTMAGEGNDEGSRLRKCMMLTRIRNTYDSLDRCTQNSVVDPELFSSDSIFLVVSDPDPTL